ncbi:MAG: cob(I)yrinic acid a,c-diamide adenosyltransferase, partial [Chloroflexota bacterium]|nr:cob(I)yrinic acid a,c-diamide adenosyltransferase [Chloroflexota bacterium]
MTPDDATATEVARATDPIDSLVATGKGDDGTTGLLYGGPRIAKDDPRTEAYGTVDEAVAALGLARAELGSKGQYGVLNPALAGLGELILRIQRELFVVGAELATTPAAWDRLVDGKTRVSGAMVEDLTTLLEDLERRIEMPQEFIVPGETRTSAALELARTILRRAERRVVPLGRDGLLPGEHLLPYLNRLADLVWVLARAAEQAEARTSTPARSDGRRRTRPAAPPGG